MARKLISFPSLSKSPIYTDVSDSIIREPEDATAYDLVRFLEKVGSQKESG